MACMKAAVSGEYAQEPGVVMKSSLVYSSVRCHQGAGGSEVLLLPSGKHHRGWRVKSTQRLGKRVTEGPPSLAQYLKVLLPGNGQQ